MLVPAVVSRGSSEMAHQAGGGDHPVGGEGVGVVCVVCRRARWSRRSCTQDVAVRLVHVDESGQRGQDDGGEQRRTPIAGANSATAVAVFTPRYTSEPPLILGGRLPGWGHDLTTKPEPRVMVESMSPRPLVLRPPPARSDCGPRCPPRHSSPGPPPRRPTQARNRTAGSCGGRVATRGEPVGVPAIRMPTTPGRAVSRHRVGCGPRRTGPRGPAGSWNDATTPSSSPVRVPCCSTWTSPAPWSSMRPT